MIQRLGEIVVKKGLISENHLRDALIIQRSGDKTLELNPNEKLGRVLLKKGYIKPMDLVRTLYEQKGNIDFLCISSYIVEPKVVTWVPKNQAEKHNILPLVSMDEDTLMIAANKKLSPDETKEIESLIRRKVEVVEVDDSNIRSSITCCYDTLKKRGVNNIRIGEILVRDQYITQEHLDEALKISLKTQRMLGKILLEKNKVNETDFFKILSMQRKMPLMSARDILPILDRSLVKNLSRAFCLRNLIVPYFKEGNKVYAATAEPSIDPNILRKPLKCKVLDLKLSSYSDIELILRTLFSEVEAIAGEDATLESEELEAVAIEEELLPVSKNEVGKITKLYQNVASNLLIEALRKGASDIHLENYENSVVVRFRIDGILYDIHHLQINQKNLSGVVNVLKIQSNMDIAERRLPQSGRFRRKTKDSSVFDFRAQTQPTLYGENLVLRVLSQTSPMLGFKQLGFSPEVEVRYEKLITSSSGIIFITGPTGSGKTTTLYSTLVQLKKDLRKKIITIEDPVEYSLERIQQCQVRENIGFGFSQATKEFMREDPDILLIGEIRDHDTAVEALRASQTGHLVLTTLHSTNTIETVQRLLDLDLNPGTIASELLLILSQRLAKKNCPHCKKEYRPSKDLLDTFYPRGVPDGLVFHKSVGCQECDFKGHKGRIAVLEFWFLDMECKQMIIKGAGFDELFGTAVAQGMVPMIKDGLMKVEEGIIPLEELSEMIPYFQMVRWKGIRSRMIFGF